MRRALAAILLGRVWAGRALAIVGAGWVALATMAAARAEAPRAGAAEATARIRLKGSAHLDVHAAREAGGLVLSGSVIDDAARPLPAAHIRIAFALASDPARSLPLAAAQSCGGPDATPSVDRGGALAVAADGAGRLCVRLVLATNRYVAHIEASGSELVEGATIDLPIDLALPAVTLRFDPERSAVSLDDDTTSLDVMASTEEEGVTAPATGLVLSLSNEVGTHLAEATTDASGHARFTVDSAHLGPPGKGELRVTFAGNATAGAGRHAMRVERQTAVELRAPDATARRLPLAWPEDGVSLRLAATARCISRGCTGAPGGTIEARVGDHTFAGAAPIDRGEAHLHLTFAAPSDGAVANASAVEVPVTLRYLPDAPWFRPTAELVLMQPVGGPSPWKKVPLVLAAAIVVAWLAIARFPTWRERKPRKKTEPLDAKPAAAGVELLRPAAPSQGWTGRVADAHDGVGLPQSRVAIERRGFDHVDVLFETTSDAGGGFALPLIDTRPGDELVAEGPLHAALRHPLPPSGEIAIALVLRRRALLDRLIAWARRQGPPYIAAPDATPGHVQRAAGSNVGVVRWASAVERAAYGAAAVDAGAQAAVDDLAPKDAGGTSGRR